MDYYHLGSRLLWFGLVAMISALIWIATAIAINPSFDFYTGALSQLGSPGSNSPWVYNTGLMFTSILLFLFSVSLLMYSRNRIEAAGSSFFMIAALFLALIGIYHGGTYPHDFVSLWFFVLADISIFTWGLGLIIHSRKWGSFVLVLGIASTTAAFVIKWPSSAELETFGTASIALWAMIMIVELRRDMQVNVDFSRQE